MARSEADRIAWLAADRQKLRHLRYGTLRSSGGAEGACIWNENSLYEFAQLGPEFEREAVFHADARDLLSVSSFLTLHAPGTNATAHFLNAETIELLPPGSVVVNAARGSLVDDDALIPPYDPAGLLPRGSMCTTENLTCVRSTGRFPTFSCCPTWAPRPSKRGR